MQSVLIDNKTHPLSQPLRIQVCKSFFSRLRGFMFQAGVAKEGGLLFIQGSESRVDAAIHMLFVNFDLGVVWIDHHNDVVDTRLARRWRPFYMPSQKAKMFLEIHPSRLAEFSAGDHLSIDLV
jgi:uncharacterized membrane protein (UPF0127 family)